MALEEEALGLIDPDAVASLDDEPEVCGDGGYPEQDGDANQNCADEQQPALEEVLRSYRLGALGDHRHCAASLQQ